MANFTPKDAATIAAEGLIKDGVYPFKVLECIHKDDSKGIVFYRVKLAVYEPGEDRPSWVWDNLSPDWFVFKLLHFCELTGLQDNYDRGELDDEDIAGREGFCKIKTAPEKDGYPAKNEVADYVSAPDGEEIKTPAPAFKPLERPAARPLSRPAKDPDLDELDDMPF